LISLILILLLLVVYFELTINAKGTSIAFPISDFGGVYVEVLDIYDDEGGIDKRIKLKVIGNYKDKSGKKVLRDNYRFEAFYDSHDFDNDYMPKKGDILKIRVVFSGTELEDGNIRSLEKSSLPITTQIYHQSKNILITLSILMIVLCIFFIQYLVERRRENRGMGHRDHRDLDIEPDHRFDRRNERNHAGSYINDYERSYPGRHDRDHDSNYERHYDRSFDRRNNRRSYY
jgi:hypothetical protein